MTMTKRSVHTIDATGASVGRLSTQIAHLLMGKHKTSFAPNVDGGDYVEVAHPEKVVISAKKAASTFHTHHTGHPGGLRQKKVQAVLVETPERVISHAVSKMLTRNRFHSARVKRLTFKK